MLSDFHPFRRKGTLKIQLCPHFTMPWKIQENSQTIPKTLPIKVWFIQLISVFFWIKLNSPEDPSISSFTFVIKYTSLKNHLLRAQGDSLPYWLQGNFCSFVCPLSAIGKMLWILVLIKDNWCYCFTKPLCCLQSFFRRNAK